MSDQNQSNPSQGPGQHAQGNAPSVSPASSLPAEEGSSAPPEGETTEEVSPSQGYSNQGSRGQQQHSVRQPAAPGETDNVQPELEDTEGEENAAAAAASVNAQAQGDDIERGVPASNASGAPGSDNTMNEEGGTGQGAAAAASSGPNPDTDMDNGSGGTSLPPIDDVRKQQKDKAAQRAAEIAAECERFKAMTLEQKKKALDAYVPAEYYTKGQYLDAQDTTNIFITGKVVGATATDVQVNYDGWPQKWDSAFRKKSYKIAPFRSCSLGYSGQTKVAIRPLMDAVSVAEVLLHVSKLESYIANDFEGKTAHQLTQYVRGHLFCFLDSLMGQTYRSADLDSEEWQTSGQHPFEHSAVQRLFRTFLRFATAYFRKVATLGKTIQELAQVPKLFLVDPQAAIVCLGYEIAESLRRIFAVEPRTLKHYLMADENQLPAEEIKRLCAAGSEVIVPNSFGAVVNDYTEVDFVARRHPPNQDYVVELVIQRCAYKQELVFGTLSNYVQYFAEVGGFDALLQLFQMGMGPDSGGDQPKPGDAQMSSRSSAAEPSSAKLPFKLVAWLTHAFTHLRATLKPDFAARFSGVVRQQILTRLGTMTERDLKDVDKDEIADLVVRVRDLLTIAATHEQAAEFAETTSLLFSLRFLKSENLEKRLRGLGEIRAMIDRAIEKSRFERWLLKQKPGRGRAHWDALPDNKERPYPSEVIRVGDMRQWLIQNQVTQYLLGPNAHIELVKRSAPILRVFTQRFGGDIFDEALVDLVWKCQQGKHEEMVRVVYNLIQEVLPSLTLPAIDSFFEKIKAMPPAQIDEKYVVFLREFSKVALRRRFDHGLNLYCDEFGAADDSQDRFLSELIMNQSEQISQLTANNAAELSTRLEAETNDYGLSLFWKVCQDDPSGGGLSNDLQELVINSIQDILSEPYVKQARSVYLFKAIHNILSSKSLVQSTAIAAGLIDCMQADFCEIPLEANSNEPQTAALTKPLTQRLQEQARLLDALVANAEAYHGEVRQKCKQLYTANGSLPDKVEEQVFSGRYPHSVTLRATLDFLELMICKAQKAMIVLLDRHEVSVSLGIENIKRLWTYFVKEPNFQSDVDVFLEWINKQRTHTQSVIINYQKKSYLYELFIFSEEEKRFLFEQFLCNPDEVDAAQISVGLVRCFQKYFRLINVAEQFMQSQKQKIKVLRFESLIGMEALWKMALLSQNAKAKELSQELLVSLHLRIDNQTATREHKQAVIEAFVKRCMKMLTPDAQPSQASDAASLIKTTSAVVAEGDKKAVVSLLSLFLERYEGVRTLKQELTQFARLTSIRPVEVDVVNAMDPENRVLQRTHISYFQTLGHLRAKIASENGYQINEFHLLIKNNQVDPDIDDDRYIKDINAFAQKCSIKRNPAYDPAQHPKYLLARSQENFSVIFSMLWASEPELSEPVWALIAKLPKNESVIDSLKTLEFIKSVTPAAGAARDEAAITTAWNSLLDPQAIFKLLYCLQIMSSQFMNVALPQRDDELYDEDMNQEFNAAIEAYGVQRVWKQEFIELGGFTHLLNCLVQLNLHEIRSSLELKAIRTLISIIFKFVNHFGEMQQLQEQENRQGAAGSPPSHSLMELQPKELRNGCVLKVIQLIDAITKYSLEQEQLRGESVEAVQKKIEQAKVKRQRQRLLALGNKAEKAKQVDDDDDGDSEDKKLLTAITTGFREQAEIVNSLFKVIQSVSATDAETPKVIVDYPDLGPMLERGMMLSENWFVRESMSKLIIEILLNLRRQSARLGGEAPDQPLQQADSQSETCFARIMEILLTTLLAKSKDPQYESRSYNFYNHVCEILQKLEPKDLGTLEAQVLGLIEQLPRDIIERPIKEVGSTDTDVLLGGLVNVLTNLLQRFPVFKKQVGAVLTQFIVHDCLFEIPHGSKNAPKCKSPMNRGNCFALLRALGTDCIENLEVVLDYMKRFNQNPSWRTNREGDWGIRLYEDEKSTTGRVGLKNLGCICYMNSLNQQLFMIPGFRNDILSVQDPNHDKNPDEDNMFLQWQTLFAGLLLSQKMYVNPKGYCHAFKDWEGNPVNVFEQMDVEEYLTMFMDRLEAAIKGTPQEKTIQYHFGGKFANEIICKTCPCNYSRDEPFLSLGVPVKNKKTFQEGMDAFIAGDLLDQDNQYNCEKCDKKVDALKRTCLKEMPRYLLATLKRFDFDFDLMIRKKLNDYFEFQVEVDLREYTQDYLNQKETQERLREERKGQADADDAMEEIKMRQPDDYYKYDLVGVIVHAGTADSGHYYSYIKEQEEFRLEGEGKDKWYEFNDIWVRDFDAAEIPAETFGGEETMGGFGNGGPVMRMRNAYVLIYKRKLTDESLLVTDEDASAAQQAAADGAEEAKSDYKLGSQALSLAPDSPLNQKIQWDNHRYWHIRYLFRDDYQSFVTSTLLYWNTARIIPAEVPWRNQDYHLLSPLNATFAVERKTSLEVKPPSEASLDLRTLNTPEAIDEAKFRVFKFAVQFYYTIQQRSSQKYGLPDMSRFLKAYINEDVRCARWFVNEFINCDMLQEIMMQNCQKLMRRVYIGIVTCAMLKLYEAEKDQLNLYWDDIDQGVDPPRQTTLGNYVNALLYLLPTLKHFSANQAQFLQLISQFCRMGIEAKRYLIRADTVQRLLNYFYYQNTPFRDSFINAPRLNSDITEAPEMGLPTPEDPTQRKSAIALRKERDRMGKLSSDSPPYMYLIDTVATLVRCMRVELAQGLQLEEGQPATPYQLHDLGFSPTNENLVLFMPDVQFIQTIFAAAHKSRAAVALSQAYVHHTFYSPTQAMQVFSVVQEGLELLDYDKIRPFLILFQHMLEAAVVPHSPVYSRLAPKWLEAFFAKTVYPNQEFFQWMEVVTDWIIKVAFRLPLMREWMQAHPELWGYMVDWYKENNEPPRPQHDRQAAVHLNKPRTIARPSIYRYSLPRRNQALSFFRRHSLICIKQGQCPDLSHEIDIDYYHLDDFKLQRDQRVQVLQDRLMHVFDGAIVATDMDELVYLRINNQNSDTAWEATDKGRVFIEGVWETSHKCKELLKYEDLFWRQHQARVKAEKAEQERERQRQIQAAAAKHGRRFDLEDDMDIDENNNTLEGGDEDLLQGDDNAAPGHANNAAGTGRQNAAGPDANEDMQDDMEQDEFQVQGNNNQDAARH